MSGQQSIWQLLLHGGEYDGVRVMGCGERLLVIGVATATTIWLAPKVAEHAVRHAARNLEARGEPRRDPRRDECGYERGYERGSERVEMVKKPFSDAATVPGHLLAAKGGDTNEPPFAVAVDTKPAPVEEVDLGGREEGLGPVDPIRNAPRLADEGAEKGEVGLVHADKDSTKDSALAHGAQNKE